MLITVAPTGGAEVAKIDHPALPTTPAEMAAATTSCRDAGAAVIHVDMRDSDRRLTMDLGRITEVISAVRDTADLIVQLSTGGAVYEDEHSRLAVLDAGPDAASLTCGSVNFGDDIFANRWPFIVELYGAMRERRIVPEFQPFDMGHIATMKRLLETEGPPLGGRVHADLVYLDIRSRIYLQQECGVAWLAARAGDRPNLIGRRGGSQGQ